MFVSPYTADRESGGGLVSRANLECLERVVPDVAAYVLASACDGRRLLVLGCPSGKRATALGNLVGFAGRLTLAALVRIIREIRTCHPEFLFVDSSSLGWVCVFAKVFSRHTHVICFFHNIEFDFQLDRSRRESRLYLLTACAELLNEFLSTKFADTLVMLTGHDSARSRRLYGREADALAPVVLRDRLAAAPAPYLLQPSGVGYALFVGSNFFANREAVEFLVSEVAPRLKQRGATKIVIVGEGFSRQQWRAAVPENVEMLGRVDDLGAVFTGATVFVAPIFSGAGMKVKVAEALMYGCPVIGTSNALRGYEGASPGAHLIRAESPEEFVAGILSAEQQSAGVREEARKDYLARFSIEAGERRMRAVLTIGAPRC
jgi:polysaccharide biosynthesis protein PslH